MAEEVTSQADASAAPQPPAASPGDPLAAQIAEMQAEFEKRIAGFQTVINKQSEEIRELKTASMSEEEREQLTESESKRYIEELERKAALAEFRASHPDIYPVYDRLLKAETPEEQAIILKELVQPKAPEVPTPQPADIDLNNPAASSEPVAGRMPDGTPISGETAWDILKRMGPAPASR